MSMALVDLKQGLFDFFLQADTNGDQVVDFGEFSEVMLNSGLLTGTDEEKTTRITDAWNGLTLNGEEEEISYQEILHGSDERFVGYLDALGIEYDKSSMNKGKDDNDKNKSSPSEQAKSQKPRVSDFGEDPELEQLRMQVAEYEKLVEDLQMEKDEYEQKLEIMTERANLLEDEVEELRQENQGMRDKIDMDAMAREDLQEQVEEMQRQTSLLERQKTMLEKAEESEERRRQEVVVEAQVDEDKYVKREAYQRMEEEFVKMEKELAHNLHEVGQLEKEFYAEKMEHQKTQQRLKEVEIDYVQVIQDNEYLFTELESIGKEFPELKQPQFVNEIHERMRTRTKMLQSTTLTNFDLSLIRERSSTLQMIHENNLQNKEKKKKEEEEEEREVKEVVDYEKMGTVVRECLAELVGKVDALGGKVEGQSREEMEVIKEVKELVMKLEEKKEEDEEKKRTEQMIENLERRGKELENDKFEMVKQMAEAQNVIRGLIQQLQRQVANNRMLISNFEKARSQSFFGNIARSFKKFL